MFAGCTLNKIFTVGYCLGRGRFADRTLGLKRYRFYTRCFLLKHAAKGLILVDTGYGQPLVDCVQKGIYSLYGKLLPFTYSQKDSLAGQLRSEGISLKDLSYLIITHFHPDHIGALPEFAAVPWIYREDALQTLLNYSTFTGLRKGFIRPLVPEIPKRSLPIREDCFTESWKGFASCDVFGDNSVHLLDLPGHALGQMGVGMHNTMLAADATWGGNALPSPLGLLVQECPKAYRKTFNQIQRLENSIQIYPTHTLEAHE